MKEAYRSKPYRLQHLSLLFIYIMMATGNITAKKTKTKKLLKRVDNRILSIINELTGEDVIASSEKNSKKNSKSLTKAKKLMQEILDIYSKQDQELIIISNVLLYVVDKVFTQIPNSKKLHELKKQWGLLYGSIETFYNHVYEDLPFKNKDRYEHFAATKGEYYAKKIIEIFS